MDRLKQARQAWLAATALHPYRDPADVGIRLVSRAVNGSLIESLLYRGDDGTLIGALTYFDGKVDIRVDPDHQRQGIGTALASEAVQRWEINLEKQDLTPAAIPFIAKLIELDIV